MPLRRALAVLSLMLPVAGCSGHASTPDDTTSLQDVAAAARARAAAPIDAASVRSRLAGLPPDRDLLAPGHADARRYLLESLAAMGLRPELRPFRWPGEPTADLANIELRWPGRAAGGPVLIVSAHYDSVPLTPGADDNGSGCAVLLELARRFAPRAFGRELRLLWFDAEEDGLIGSGTWVRELPEAELRRIQGVINLETLGYTDRRPGSQRMPEGTRVLFDPGDRGDFLLVLGNLESRALAAAVQAALEPEQGEAFRSVMYSLVPGAGWLLPDSRRSDHAVFWDRNVPAVLLTDTANLRSPHYHAPSDTLETLDLPFLAAAARGIERAVLALAEPLDG